MSIFGKKNKNGDRSVNLKYIDGVEAYSNGTAVALSIDNTNECITMIARVYKKPPVHLKFEQVTGVRVVSEKEIIEKSKSAVGRAIVGEVLLGPLGAIVGGISGIGTQKENKTHNFIVINYKSKDDEIKVLSFEIVGSSLHWSSFVDELKQKIKKEDVPNEIHL
ncbi:hypothetical protein [Clostridium beijerinckii]|uniref:hypothetical protein n=1 Tax=Clostridium beijerinckii TaxID=1520 RepID=UPI00149465D6|nr:hypothetical protein [Clostridium beijerinckii]NOW02487.1 hypothetical protein [Clostridium beijerinckii]NYC04371.1 hypothetical protein [Clostridium beijerinckii]NYC05610.1 hypothetical protein [Clostridium beijerinckii]